MNKILITYATKTGSTSEIAQFIGDVLEDDGFEVDVREIGEVVDLGGYQTIVIGSATRMDKVLNEAVKFMLQHQKEIQYKTTAYFLVGVTMKEDNPENRQKSEATLAPLCEIKEPISMGLFAGKLDYSKIGLFWRVLASKDKTGFMEEGDFRDWIKIKDWAIELAKLLQETRPIANPDKSDLQ